ncbi:MAG: hypothetical protein BroJett040_06890 [Oligoflexia bacterium]|nr:MAG: hypothetical protein BroJett040_06890 [Oligoflexia bacterium]
MKYFAYLCILMISFAATAAKVQDHPAAPSFQPNSITFSLTVTVEGRPSSTGTAFAISPFRLITSMDHVLASIFLPGQRQILISNPQTSMRVELVYVDPIQNIAVLQTSTSLPSFPGNDNFKYTPPAASEKLIVVGASSLNNFIRQEAFYVQPVKVGNATQHQLVMSFTGPLLGAPVFDSNMKIMGVLNKDNANQIFMNDIYAIQGVMSALTSSDPSISKQFIKYLTDVTQKKILSIVEFRESQPMIIDTWTAGSYSKNLKCVKEDPLKTLADQYQIQIVGSQSCETTPAFMFAPGQFSGIARMNFRALSFANNSLKLSQKINAIDRLTNSESLQFLSSITNSKIYNNHKCVQIQTENRQKTTLLIKICTATLINFPELHTSLVRVLGIDRNKELALATIKVDLMTYETTNQLITRVINDLGHSL